MADTPRLTVRCEYPGSGSPPSEVSFRLSPSYGIQNEAATPIERELGEGRVARRVRAIYGTSLTRWGLLVPPPP